MTQESAYVFIRLPGALISLRLRELRRRQLGLRSIDATRLCAFKPARGRSVIGSYAPTADIDGAELATGTRPFHVQNS